MRVVLRRGSPGARRNNENYGGRFRTDSGVAIDRSSSEHAGHGMHWKADLGGLAATIEYSSKNKKLNGYRAVAPLVVARWTTMVIQFDTTELRSLCEDETLATQKLGSDARLLIARLADLISAPSLGELPPGIAHPVEGLTDRYCIEIGAYWLVFVPNHKDPLIGEDGALETRKVTRLKVISIDHD